MHFSMFLIKLQVMNFLFAFCTVEIVISYTRTSLMSIPSIVIFIKKNLCWYSNSLTEIEETQKTHKKFRVRPLRT